MIGAVLNFSVRADIRVSAVGMLYVPVEVVGVWGNMGLPFIVRRVEITILITPWWIS
jgi:hypothetical protein